MGPLGAGDRWAQPWGPGARGLSERLSRPPTADPRGSRRLRVIGRLSRRRTPGRVPGTVGRRVARHLRHSRRCRKGPRGVRGVKERWPQLRVHSTLPAGAAEWLRGPEPRSPVCRMGTQQSPRPGAGSRWRVTGRGGVSSQTRQAFLSFFALFAPSPFPSPRLEKCFQPGRWEAFCPELTIFQNAWIPFRAGLWKPESLSFTTHGTRH